MRCSFIKTLAAGLLLLLPSAGSAQQRDPIHINSVRVGYTFLGTVTDFKAGFWTPVYVDVQAWAQGVPRGELVVESVDSDDVRNRYTVALPALEPNEQATVVAYTKPGSQGSEITVTALIDGKRVAQHQDSYAAMELGHQMFLAVGSHLPGLRSALNPKDPNRPEGEPAETRDQGPRHVTSVDDVRSLPNRWYAYEAVDLLILTTGDRDFLTALTNDREGRKEAIAEWVRRGGRLLVSVGRNQDMVAKLDVIHSLLPVAVTGLTPRPQLQSVRVFSRSDQPFQAGTRRTDPSAARPPIEVAKLEPKPGREVDTVLVEHNGPLVIARGAYGLGRVTVVAFDLDKDPFTTWLEAGQRGFWNALLDQTAPAYKPEPADQGRNAAFYQPENHDLATQLQMNLEDFQDVPVISFGWVALFILIYILIVGPLDYFFLKKVVKRLELTWITFPTVVITISVVAYFTAYWLKGNDQRVNKVDFIDLDLHTQQAYGTSWFTVFSPRIQHYTVGLEPVMPDWVAPGDGKAPPVVVSWLGRPETGWGGSARAGSQGLFRRAYDYAPDAAGLIGVPIQVWSTKSFTAQWQAPFDPKRPLVEADLQHPPGNRDAITGQIISRLPVPLEDVVLHHGQASGGKWYTLDKLFPDTPRRVDNIQAGGGGMDMNQWLTSTPQSVAARPAHTPGTAPQSGATTPLVIKRLLFYQAAASGGRDNLLRYLDQSWRLGHKDEVILFGRIARQEGPAEEVTTRKETPTRLWLGALPGAGQQRPVLSGTLAQETYVRMIIPVRSAAGQ
jgi:hypothetical protein